MKFKVLVVLAVGMLGVSGVASANLITNGDFETGSFSNWSTSGLTCSGVGSGFSGATGGCFGYDVDPGPFAGAYSAYLGTAAGGGIISQSFATVAGQNYLLDFYLANGSYLGTTAPNSFLAQVNATTLFSLTNVPAQNFGHYTYGFTGSGGSMTLAFTHGNAPSFFILDNVSVRAVPEPGTLALFGLGLVALGLIRRRRSA